MARYGIAALVGIIYVACAAWVVHGMGQAHRDSLRQSREVAARPAVPTGDARVPAPAPPPASAPREKAEPAPPMPPASTAVASNQPAAPTPVEEKPRPVAPVPAPNPPAAAVPQPKPPRPPDPWTDLAHLKPEDERELGRQLNNVVMTYNRRMDSGPWLRRVVELGRPLTETCARKDVNYTFTVLDSDEVNSFSLPGGYIYVTRGLFDLIGDDEDYALEFAIGHEIAHVDLKHALKCLEGKNVAVSERGLSTVEQFYLLIAFGYPEEQEFEADAWIYQRMRKRDRTLRESLAFLRKFEGYAKSRGFENGRKLPPEKSEAPAVENHYRAHPAAWDRLGRLKALAGKGGTPPAAAPPR